MRVVPVEQIVQHTVSESANDCYEPAIDRRGFVKPMSSMEALVSGKFHKVPVLLGVTENDGLGKSELEQTIFRSSDVRTRAELEKLLQLEFGENAQHVLEHYWQKDVESDAKAVHKSLSLLSNDLWYFAGTYHMAQLISCSSPVFLYCFAGAKRSMHGSDMVSWRGNAKSKLSQIMSQYLGNFARYGNPNGGKSVAVASGEGALELPVWKSMSEAPAEWMFLNTEPAMREMNPDDLLWYKFLASEYFSKRILEKVKAFDAHSDGPEENACKRICVKRNGAALWLMLHAQYSLTLPMK